MHSKKSKLLSLGGIFCLAFLLLLDNNFLSGRQDSTPHKNFKLLDTVISLIKNEYVEKPNPLRTMEGAFKGLIDSLDVQSSYLDSTSVLRYGNRADINLKDTGVVVYKRFGAFPVIIGIKKNSPAEKAGLKVGEEISAMDDRSALIMTMLEANLYQKHIENKPVKFKIIRGNKPQEFNVERARLFDSPFSYSVPEQTDGILHIHSFFPPLVDSIKKQLLPLLENKQSPLIIDLRNCHEGNISEAIDFINLFLKEENIGYFERKGEEKEKLACLKTPEFPHLPLLLWTNQSTFGPAEIVASVLKKHKEAKVIGFSTPGLTARQKLFLLEDGSGIVLTSAIFHLPESEEIWLKGIKPDVRISINDQTSSAYLKATQNILTKYK